MRPALLAAAVVLLAGPGWARNPRCMADVLADIPADENPEAVLHKSDSPWGPVTQLRLQRKNSVALFCAHGDYCYAAAKLSLKSPCTFKKDTLETDDQLFFSAQ